MYLKKIFKTILERRLNFTEYRLYSNKLLIIIIYSAQNKGDCLSRKHTIISNLTHFIYIKKMSIITQLYKKYFALTGTN